MLDALVEWQSRSITASPALITVLPPRSSRSTQRYGDQQEASRAKKITVQVTLDNNMGLVSANRMIYDKGGATAGSNGKAQSGSKGTNQQQPKANRNNQTGGHRELTNDERIDSLLSLLDKPIIIPTKRSGIQGSGK